MRNNWTPEEIKAGHTLPMSCKHTGGAATVPSQLVLMTNEQCLCEYVEHFNHPDELNEHHAYAHRCEGVMEVQTIYGVYPICLKCREDHPVPTDMLGRDIEGIRK